MSSTAATTDRYPSRTVAEASITERLDPVVWGPEEGPLDPELIQSYEDSGFLVLPNLLAPHEVSALDAAVEELATDDEVKASPRAIVEPGSNALRSLFGVHDGPGPLSALARDPRLTGIARQLLGSEVYIHQSRINLKPGFRGKEFYWHSDFETWHTEDGMPSMRAVSCSVLLTPNHSWNGPLLCIAGSHRWYVSCVGETPDRNYEKSLRAQEIGVPDDDSLAELTRRGSIAECYGPAGTVVFFECNVMHGSNSNITPAPRRNVFMVFNSMENTLVEPFAAPDRRPEHIAAREFVPV